MINRDELAKSLRVGFEAIIREANEWRPLADHVLALIEYEVADRCKDCANSAPKGGDK